MIAKVLIYTLLVHWIGDFYLQSDWMATNKSKSLKALGAHVFMYSFCLLCFMFPIVNNILLFVAINGALHFCVDFCTSRITSYLWAKSARHHFFVVIGLDQWLHNCCLILTTLHFLKA